MADYIELALIDDPDALLEIGVNYIEGAVPGLQARPGNPETVLLEAQSQIAAEIVQQAAQVPPIAFAYAGQSLFGIDLQEAVPATATATITFATSTPASMIAAESMIAVPHPSGESMIFTTDADVAAIMGGGDVTVGVTALEAGSQANGAFGTAELIDVVDGVQTVAVTQAAGGVDEESDDAYLDRLADALTLLAPRPILPSDFATMARQVPGVERATALDLYQPGTNDNVTAAQLGGPLNVEGTPVNAGAGVSNVPRCVTTVITADNGLPPTQALMHTVWSQLDTRREVNFLAYVIAPRYTTIDVKATVHAYKGYVAADVQAAVSAVLASWLSPARFSQPPTAIDDATQLWSADNLVRYTEAVEWLNRADGVHWVELVQLRASGGVFGTTDVSLGAPIGLPLPGAFTITVVVNTT
jgi:hypothetical protein